MGEGSKQVKVDNWGIFFLQRLQQFYNKTYFCDLTLQFEDNVQLKVHRLVMNACTEYFQMLEQASEVERESLMMPSNLEPDIVVPIINFMYTGILEFQESSFDRLYSTAKLMNMTVLTKLLDAQKVPISPISKPVNRRVQSVTPITWNLQGKKITAKSFMEPELPEPLPGRKLPIWKRKSAPNSMTYRSTESSNNYSDPLKTFKSTVDETPKPTRFEWPDEDDNTNFENSFDEISYTSKPLIMPSIKEKNSSKPSTSNFEEVKRMVVNTKRSASPIGNQCKKVNIQDVKEYLKEHKIRSDFIDYDDSEATDNDLQTFDNDDSNEECSKDASDIFTQNTEENPSKSILKNDASTSPSSKHVRFSLEGKENTKVHTPSLKLAATSSKPGQSSVDMSNHTKIITEVLKKYPHLVKKNKNIRLKILAKGSKSPNVKSTKSQVNVTTSTSKVSYMVMKPDGQKQNSAIPTTDKEKNIQQDQGPWECTRCEGETIQFPSYYLFRQHLTDVHKEKQDSQMCNLCGHISRKQNLLVYHKFTKHGIQPPAMYNFPKCKACNYVALSQTLLIKHQHNHSIVNLTCLDCGTAFPTKVALVSHLQQTGHQKLNVPIFECNYCDKRFVSENVLITHIKTNHELETKDDENKMDITEDVLVKHKEKIKILSDIKVNTTLPTTTLELVGSLPDNQTKAEEVSSIPEPLEPSSEAEALSNVASGIAASLGLVDTIVVLDENQFILQSTQHGHIQENILNNSEAQYILPELTPMHNSVNVEHVSQIPVTLSSATSSVLDQTTLNKSGMTSTDELVMVLTDHDYSDAANNTVMSDSNIVVLYSHPVQTQGTMMINSETGMIEVSKGYTETVSEISTTGQVEHCEESIELIQQEINSQLEVDGQLSERHIQYGREEKMDIESPEEMESKTYGLIPEDNLQDIENTVPIKEQMQVDNNLEMEESIEMIQDEINKIPQEIDESAIGDNQFEDHTDGERVNDDINNQLDEVNENLSEFEIVEKISDEVETVSNSENIQQIHDEDKSFRNLDIKQESELISENDKIEQETSNKLSNIDEHGENSQYAVNDTCEKAVGNECENQEHVENTESKNVNEVVCDLEEDQSISEVLGDLGIKIPQQTENINSNKIESSQNTTYEHEEHKDEIESIDNENEIETIQNPEIPMDNELISPEDNHTDLLGYNVDQIENSTSPKENSTDLLNYNNVEQTQNTDIPETMSNEPISSKMQLCDTYSEASEKPMDKECEESNEENMPQSTTDNMSEILQENSTEEQSVVKEINRNDNGSKVDKVMELGSMAMANEKISNLLDDWDDGDTDSQQSDVPKTTELISISNNGNSINRLIDDWEDEEDT